MNTFTSSEEIDEYVIDDEYVIETIFHTKLIIDSVDYTRFSEYFNNLRRNFPDIYRIVLRVVVGVDVGKFKPIQKGGGPKKKYASPFSFMKIGILAVHTSLVVAIFFYLSGDIIPQYLDLINMEINLSLEEANEFINDAKMQNLINLVEKTLGNFNEEEKRAYNELYAIDDPDDKTMYSIGQSDNQLSVDVLDRDGVDVLDRDGVVVYDPNFQNTDTVEHALQRLKNKKTPLPIVSHATSTATTIYDGLGTVLGLDSYGHYKLNELNKVIELATFRKNEVEHIATKVMHIYNNIETQENDGERSISDKVKKAASTFTSFLARPNGVGKARSQARLSIEILKKSLPAVKSSVHKIPDIGQRVSNMNIYIYNIYWELTKMLSICTAIAGGLEAVVCALSRKPQTRKYRNKQQQLDDAYYRCDQRRLEGKPPLKSDMSQIETLEGKGLTSSNHTNILQVTNGNSSQSGGKSKKKRRKNQRKRKTKNARSRKNRKNKKSMRKQSLKKKRRRRNKTKK